jgi:hypothetical protein
MTRSLLAPVVLAAALLFCRNAAASYGPWTATSFGAYMAPTSGFIGADGGVDVVVHFHGARLADREWRTAGLDAVVVDADFGGVSTPFHDAMERPERFGEMVDEVLVSLRARRGVGELFVRRLAVVSFSAGYAAVVRVLDEPGYVDRIDAVLLLDSLHASYADTRTRAIDRAAMAPFLEFGRLAGRGKKLMVVTHSDVAPPDYGSTTETAFTLTVALGGRLEPTVGRTERGLWKSDRSDLRGYHMRGYWGASPDAHVQHLHLVGDVVREFLVPRWSEP